MSGPLFRIVCLSGWLFALALAAVIVPKAYKRWFYHVPVLREREWQSTLAAKEAALASKWMDRRPLVLMAGDSQIELGNWYDLFSGGLAVRNCGLSQAKIEDVDRLIAAIGDRRPKGVVLMCGVNNLSTGDTPDECLREYQALLERVRVELNPQFVMVLSVMPVRESAVDARSRDLNRRIREFNAGLPALCDRNGARFQEVGTAVAAGHGGLASELTFDGLHLNSDGYRRLTGAIAPDLFRLAGSP